MRQPIPRREVPAAFARAIRLGYEKRGLDMAPALQRAGLAEAIAGEAVPLDAFEALSDCAMRELDDEALGWFSRRLPWGSYGMLLRASLTAPDLDIALRRWARHHNLLTGDIRIAARGGAVVIEECADLGPFREFALVSLLRNVHGVACWLTDSRIGLDAAEFPFSAPPHAAAYARMFPGRIRFEAPAAALRFDAGDLRLPVVRDDAALRRRLQRPIPLMARPYRQDRLLSQRVLGLMAAEAGDTGQIALRLGLSARSLQRHLQGERTSLLALRNRARRERAEELLRHPDLPIKRIAHLLGYDSAPSFSRAFRRWTGRTPADFRRGAGADRP